MTEYLLNAQIKDHLIFKGLTDVMKTQIDELTFYITDEGIKVYCIPSEKVYIYSLIPRNSFKNFEFKENTYLTIPTGILSDIIKTTNKREEMSFIIREDDPNVLDICFHDIEDNRTKNYKLVLPSNTSRPPNLSDMNHDYTLNIPSKTFQQIVKELKVLNESFCIGKDKEGLFFSSANGNLAVRTYFNLDDVPTIETEKSNDDSGVHAEYDKEKDTWHVQKNNKEQSDEEKEEQLFGKYSIKTFTNIIKASCISDMVKMHIGSSPTVLEYIIGDVGVLRFIVFS